MVYKGCRRNVVYIKDLGTDLFDGAYFILNENAYTGMDEQSVLADAEMIAQRSLGNSTEGEKKIVHPGSLYAFWGFAAGFFSAVAFLWIF